MLLNDGHFKMIFLCNDRTAESLYHMTVIVDVQFLYSLYMDY
jgi:hypothetical protein